MYDTHAHLTFPQLGDIELTVQKSKDAGLLGIISCSTKLENIPDNFAIAKKYPDFIYPTVGIHPEAVEEFCKKFEKNCEKLEKFVSTNRERIVAIGECGLDYFHKTDNIEDQKKVFEFQIELAIKYKLPMIIHTRNAAAHTPPSTPLLAPLSKERGINPLLNEGVTSCIMDGVEMLKKHLKKTPAIKTKKMGKDLVGQVGKNVNKLFHKPSKTYNLVGVCHCFTGNLEEAKAIIDLGFYLGFTNIVTYKSAVQVQEVLKWAKENHADKILFETDSPYLPPVANRGGICYPKDVREVYKFKTT